MFWVYWAYNLKKCRWVSIWYRGFYQVILWWIILQRWTVIPVPQLLHFYLSFPNFTIRSLNIRNMIRKIEKNKIWYVKNIFSSRAFRQQKDCVDGPMKYFYKNYDFIEYFWLSTHFSGKLCPTCILKWYTLIVWLQKCILSHNNLQSLCTYNCGQNVVNFTTWHRVRKLYLHPELWLTEVVKFKSCFWPPRQHHYRSPAPFVCQLFVLKYFKISFVGMEGDHLQHWTRCTKIVKKPQEYIFDQYLLGIGISMLSLQRCPTMLLLKTTNQAKRSRIFNHVESMLLWLPNEAQSHQKCIFKLYIDFWTLGMGIFCCFNPTKEGYRSPALFRARVQKLFAVRQTDWMVFLRCTETPVQKHL